MFGDDINDLFKVNTFRTGDAELQTRAQYSDPVRFDQAAYDQAIRDMQATLPTPVWARQYPLYLRTIRSVQHPTQLMIEERAHRRPTVIDPDIEPHGGTPVHSFAQALGIAFTTSSGALGP